MAQLDGKSLCPAQHRVLACSLHSHLWNKGHMSVSDLPLPLSLWRFSELGPSQLLTGFLSFLSLFLLVLRSDNLNWSVPFADSLASSNLSSPSSELFIYCTFQLKFRFGSFSWFLLIDSIYLIKNCSHTFKEFCRYGLHFWTHIYEWS